MGRGRRGPRTRFLAGLLVLLTSLALAFLVPEGWPLGLVGPYPGATLGVRRAPFALVAERSEPFFAYVLSVDGRPVRAGLASGRGAFGFLPSLRSGRHSLSLWFLAPRHLEHRTWRVEVASDAIAALPPESPTGRRVRLLLSSWRRLAGVAPLAYDASLQEAALRHARYFARHLPRSGAVTPSAHDEVPGTDGFVGRGPLARDTYYGFPGEEVSEVMAFGAPPETATQLWIDSVYHRLGILDPSLTAMGFGEVGRGNSPLLPVTVTNLGSWLIGGLAPTKAVVLPADGMRRVPRSFPAGEVPDPLAAFPKARYPVGFPITVAFFSPSALGVTDVQARLTENGRPVPFYLLTPANDPNAEELGTAVALLKSTPFAPRARYDLDLSLRVVAADGRLLPFRTHVHFFSDEA